MARTEITSMTDKHTPGPWGCLRYAGTAFEITAAHKTMALINRRMTHTTIEGKTVTEDGPFDETEALANARLIAAAPLLLDTLRMVQFSSDGYCPWCEGHNFHLTDCNIDAAIRAATGEEA